MFFITIPRKSKSNKLIWEFYKQQKEEQIGNFMNNTARITQTAARTTQIRKFINANSNKNNANQRKQQQERTTTTTTTTTR
jgi:ABC-type uncharacterized transport system fused permease/ATPase subunit